NPGTAPAGNVAITNPLPAQTTFVSASAGGQLTGNEVRWSIGTLAAGANRTVDLVLRAQNPGTICTRPTATAERGLKAQAEACTGVLGVSALLLEVVDTADPVEVGGDTSYVIIVRNQGTLPANEVRIVARVPEEMDLTRVTGPSDHTKDGRTIHFHSFTLQPRGEARFVVYVKARMPGDVRFKVELSAKELSAGPIHEEESTTIYTGDPPSARRHRPGGLLPGRLGSRR